MNVIAGNVTLNSPTGDTSTPGASLIAPSETVTIFSAASGGSVSFSLSAPGADYGGSSVTAFGTLALGNGSSIAVGGPGSGSVIVQAGTITLDNSTISSVNTGSTAGGDIMVQATGALSLLDGGQILCGTQGIGGSGNITVGAFSMTIDGAGTSSGVPTGIFDTTALAANGGDSGGAERALSVSVGGVLTIESGGEIAASTLSAGQAGNLSVQAGSLTIDGANPPINPLTGLPFRTGIINESGAPGSRKYCR